MIQYDDSMEMKNYKIACETLQPDQERIETMIQRKHMGKRIRHTKAAVLAAACMGICACSIVGTAAANHFQIQFFVDGKVNQTEAEMEKKEDNYVLHVQGGKETKRNMSLAEQLGVCVILHADTDTVGLALGDREIDITDEIRETGEYKTTWESEGKRYLVKVTDGNPEPTVTLTEQ